MASMAFRFGINASIISITCFLVVVADPQYGLQGGNITLIPTIKGPFEEILWKHRGNKVVEFNGKENKEFGSYADRTVLDWDDAVLVISQLTDQDSGPYTLDAVIKGDLQYSKHDVEVIAKVLQPTITCVVNDTSNTMTPATMATLQCSAEPLDPRMTFSWVDPPHIGPDLPIPVENKHDEAVFECLVRNPVSEMTAQFNVKDCFPDESSSTGLAVGLSMGCLILLILVIVAIFVYKKFRRGADDVEKSSAEVPQSNPDNVEERQELLSNVHATDPSDGNSETTQDGTPQKGLVKESIEKIEHQTKSESTKQQTSQTKEKKKEQTKSEVQKKELELSATPGQTLSEEDTHPDQNHDVERSGEKDTKAGEKDEEKGPDDADESMEGGKETEREQGQKDHEEVENPKLGGHEGGADSEDHSGAANPILLQEPEGLRGPNQVGTDEENSKHQNQMEPESQGENVKQAKQETEEEDKEKDGGQASKAAENNQEGKYTGETQSPKVNRGGGDTTTGIQEEGTDSDEPGAAMNYPGPCREQLDHNQSDTDQEVSNSPIQTDSEEPKLETNSGTGESRLETDPEASGHQNQPHAEMTSPVEGEEDEGKDGVHAPDPSDGNSETTQDGTPQKGLVEERVRNIEHQTKSESPRQQTSQTKEKKKDQTKSEMQKKELEPSATPGQTISEEDTRPDQNHDVERSGEKDEEKGPDDADESMEGGKEPEREQGQKDHEEVENPKLRGHEGGADSEDHSGAANPILLQEPEGLRGPNQLGTDEENSKHQNQMEPESQGENVNQAKQETEEEDKEKDGGQASKAPENNQEGKYTGETQSPKVNRGGGDTTTGIPEEGTDSDVPGAALDHNQSDTDQEVFNSPIQTDSEEPKLETNSGTGEPKLETDPEVSEHRNQPHAETECQLTSPVEGNEDEGKDGGMETGDEGKDGGMETRDEGKGGGMETGDEGKDGGMNTRDEGKDGAMETGDEGKDGGMETRDEGKDGGMETRDEGKDGAMETRDEGKDGAMETGDEGKDGGMETRDEGKGGAMETRDEGKDGGMETRDEGKDGAMETGDEGKDGGMETRDEEHGKLDGRVGAAR